MGRIENIDGHKRVKSRFIKVGVSGVKEAGKDQDAWRPYRMQRVS